MFVTTCKDNPTSELSDPKVPTSEYFLGNVEITFK